MRSENRESRVVKAIYEYFELFDLGKISGRRGHLAKPGRTWGSQVSDTLGAQSNGLCMGPKEKHTWDVLKRQEEWSG